MRVINSALLITNRESGKICHLSQHTRPMIAGPLKDYGRNMQMSTYYKPMLLKNPWEFRKWTTLLLTADVVMTLQHSSSSGAMFKVHVGDHVIPESTLYVNTLLKCSLLKFSIVSLSFSCHWSFLLRWVVQSCPFWPLCTIKLFYLCWIWFYWCWSTSDPWRMMWWQEMTKSLPDGYQTYLKS